MGFEKMPFNSEEILNQLVAADNPTEVLCCLYKNGNAKEKAELRSIIQKLCQDGYINVNWADNRPYLVTINDSARTYSEHLAECLVEKRYHVSYVANDNSIHIGDGNTIENATVASQINKAGQTAESDDNKGFFKRHPVLTDLLVGILVAFFMMFAFWEKIVTWIEGVF